MTVKCGEFPSKIGKFKKNDCEDDRFVDFCRTHNNHLVCISARNIEKDINFDRDVTKTWIPEGFGILKGDNEIREFSVGDAGHTGFSDNEIVGEIKKLVGSFNDKDMLNEVVEEMKER